MIFVCVKYGLSTAIESKSPLPDKSHCPTPSRLRNLLGGAAPPHDAAYPSKSRKTRALVMSRKKNTRLHHGPNVAATISSEKLYAASGTFTPGTEADKPPRANDAKCGFACHTVVQTKDYVFTEYGKR
jgi:hypothetical protein